MKRLLAALLGAVFILCGAAQAKATSFTQGTLAGNGQIVTSLPGGVDNAALVQLTGTFSGTIVLECSIDATTWTASSAILAFAGGATTASITANGLYGLSITGCQQLRARVSAYVSGSGVISIQTAAGGGTGFTFDGAGNLNVTGVVGVSSAILGAGTASFGKLNPAVYHQSTTNLQTGCPASPACTWTITITGLNTLYMIRNVGPAMTGSVDITCYDGASTAGVVIFGRTQMGGNQYNQMGGPGGLALTTNSVTCAITSGQFLLAGESIQLETNV